MPPDFAIAYLGAPAEAIDAELDATGRDAY